MVDSANGGNGIPQLDYNGSLVTTDDATAYDCCVSCQTETDCQAYAFLGHSICNIVSAQNCDGSSDLYASFESQDGYSPSAGFTIGNGPCGQIADAGILGS